MDENNEIESAVGKVEEEIKENTVETPKTNDDFTSDIGDDFKVEKETTTSQDFQKDTSDTASTGGGSNYNSSKGLDLFDADTVVPGMKIDFSVKPPEKSFYFAIANDELVIDEETKAKLIKPFRKLAMKGYKLRVTCTFVKQMFDTLSELFDYEDVLVLKPWKKFCKVTGFKTSTPSDDNIRATAFYVKNFSRLPVAVKFFTSTLTSALFGIDNKSKVNFIIIYDPNIPLERNKDNKIDYKLSKNTSNVFFAFFTYKGSDFNTYNFAHQEDIDKLMKILD